MRTLDRIFRKTACGQILPVLLLTVARLTATGTEITVGERTSNQVSPYLTGFNIVYSHEDMDTWKSGEKAEVLKTAGINCLRYPGGHVVSFWDWEFPFHETYANFWDPAYIESLSPGKLKRMEKENRDRMLLDDFFQVCRETGSEPVVGINMFQGYKYNRTEDSIAKAVRLVRESRNQYPDVKYYYLDNEAGHQPERGNHVPTDEYIRLIPAYARAIKEIQPDAQLIVNPIRWNSVRGLIEQVGEHVDMIDNHWYYTNRKWGLFYIEDWRREEKNKSFEQEMNQFNKWKQETGNKHLKMGILEWNLGPARGTEGSDVHSYLFQGLVQANMLMYFIQHNVFMAACWPMMWAPSGPQSAGSNRNFFDPATNRVSPSKTIFKWFAEAGNGTVLDSEIPTSKGIQAIAVLEADGKHILVYVLNKSENAQNLILNLSKPATSASAQVFQEGSNVNDVVVKGLPVKSADETISFVMPDTSLAFLRVEID